MVRAMRDAGYEDHPRAAFPKRRSVASIKAISSEFLAMPDRLRRGSRSIPFIGLYRYHGRDILPFIRRNIYGWYRF
ncbi:MAG: hypothetical protein ACYC5K_07055 [Saccharofermentanales bacterium]